MYTFSSVRGHILQKSLKCTPSAPKPRETPNQALDTMCLPVALVLNQKSLATWNRVFFTEGALKNLEQGLGASYSLMQASKERRIVNVSLGNGMFPGFLGFVPACRVELRLRA